MIEAVVFDIGMVLVEWHPEDFYDARIGVEKRQALFAECDLHAMNQRIDLGEHSRDVAYGHAKLHPKWADEIRLWHDNWIDMLSPDIPGSAKLLRAIRAKGMPVYALTNFGDNTLEWAASVYPILNEFDATFVSGRLNLIKPNPAIYEAVEQGTGVAPEALLFADDSAKNVAGAHARGWKAHLFEHPQGWADRLVAEGVLSAEEAAL